MARRSTAALSNLPAQGFILLIIMIALTSSAIGLPAIWLFREQIDRQAQDLVEQGDQMVNVLLDARYNELGKLALLTAQRPTLAELLESGEPESLAAYLETLQTGAGLDLVMVCRTGLGPVAQVGLPIPPEACQANTEDRVFIPPEESSAASDPAGWLLASQPLPGRPQDFVVVGQAVNSGLSDQLSQRIGLEHLFLFDGELLEGSFPDDESAWEALSEQSAAAPGPDPSTGARIVEINGTSYYTAGSAYGDTGLETVVFLPGTLLSETQQRLTRTIAAGILLVTALGSILAIILARQVSRPLIRLRDAAVRLRRGDLTTPIVATTNVNEIAQVAYALDDARLALLHTLQELRQEKAWADHLLESVSEGIITLDRHGRITFFSRGAERISGWKQEQVLGKPVDEVLLVTDRDARFSQRVPSPGDRQEIVTILAQGRPVTLAVSGAALAPPEAGRANLAVSIRDISNEEAMRGLLGDFLANVTHEFRTPLTALAVSIELLLDQLPDLSPTELRELLESNHIGVLSLQNLIDNLLEGASIEAGRFSVSPRPTEMAGVIQEVGRVMAPLLEKNQHTLQLYVPADLPLVRADPRRTTQVLVNLLSNAIKWSPRGSEIALRAEADATAVRVSVADRGPGISAEQKQDLFVRFGRVQSENDQAGYGAGLGLSVVKAIVESQEGQVGVEDRQDGGTIFWFTVPVVAPEAQDEESIQ